MFARLKGCRLMGLCDIVWRVRFMLCSHRLFIDPSRISGIGLFNLVFISQMLRRDAAI